MQLTDFMMGAISYQHNNEAKANQAKAHIIRKIQQHSGDNSENQLFREVEPVFIELQ